MGRIFGVPLAAKSEKKRALLRYRLKAASEYKRAMQRRDGSSGAASPVRRIDPVTGEITEIIHTKAQSKP